MASIRVVSIRVASIRHLLEWQKILGEVGAVFLKNLDLENGKA